MIEEKQNNPLDNEEKREGRDDKGRFIEGNNFSQGRPKGSLSLISMLKEELQEEIKDKASGNKITIARALIKKYLKKAVFEEDVRLMIDTIDRIDGKPNQPYSDKTEPEDNQLIELLKNADKKTKQQFKELIRKIYRERDNGSRLLDRPSVDDRKRDISKLQ